MAKKKTVKKGLHLRKSSKGLSVHIHAGNGNKLTVLTGYNTKQSVQKGLSALHDELINAHYGWKGPQRIYDITDTTQPVKKAAKKAVKHTTAMR